ncbi:3-deoxy-D-arabinoheptulosonate-7-phosphate synthase [Campylobacter concisus]|uniref:3-deoxy-D-arabinoheptulosonate-7-phosphate synthase n=1 Tax=Campylobacter concisus TaxID=199 RepID=UPI000CD7F9EC|nr:3-deoxy-D-arabinoheptulosonate-7-phosphate synthase [Campylobacter concisus]
MHTRYTYKFNEAYALNNISYKPMSIKEAYDKNSTNSYCYYPVMIYQNYISLNLNRLFLGANISSGGLDYNSFIYYDIDHKNNKLSFNLASKLALNNLSAYLCLDELRGSGNEIDARYFNYARSRYTESDVEIRELNLDVKEEKEIYNVYKENNRNKYNYMTPIDAYQKAIDIINKFKQGIFNTDDKNSHSNLSRDLVEALDTIGNNNIKGIYVGCKIEHGKRTKETIPPRLVGRLATTIVMEDGLYIG